MNVYVCGREKGLNYKILGGNNWKKWLFHVLRSFEVNFMNIDTSLKLYQKEMNMAISLRRFYQLESLSDCGTVSVEIKRLSKTRTYKKNTIEYAQVP